MDTVKWVKFNGGVWWVQVLPLLQHGPPEPERDVRAGEPRGGAHRLPGPQHLL